MDTFLDFAPGDLVVHRDHGIARFIGLVVMESGANRLSATHRLRDNVRKKRTDDEALEEYLTLEFAQGTKLHVPCTKIDQVQKYVGGFRGQPALSAIGGQRWKKQKEQVFESVRGLASELLRVRAAREHLPGVRFPADTTWQKEFEAEFPYDETEDQLAALSEIKRDMQQERPMDRLLCGDVGYGKTELAIRAAFKAVEFGKQVAVLVPTTVLAEQHERTFRGRFADYPFRVASLSRFKTTKEISDTLDLVKKGQIDIVVGTHRLLSKDVRFADLGLVVVDEEQRFGVEHKERLLSLRMTVDVLTLSATPIPRTLHMSMLGLRDISSLATAPVDRRAVVTEVIPYNERRISQAIARELARDGQIYFVHNRVHNIQSVADTVKRLAGEKARVVIGHGQMPDGELEEVILKFVRREADILVCTTIIESGIDIPTANTMVIADADRFGLADLHQLRGRVGRYKHRAYCYLLTPEDRPVTDKATKRLKAIEEYSMLGAGFKIAMRDLEIRGAGNILGPEQSGHISAVGYEMYCQLLEKAVRELNGEITAVSSDTAVDLGVSGYIPKGYVPSDLRRMEAYRRLAVAGKLGDVVAFERDVTAAYGAPPPNVRRLIDVTELRVALTHMGVKTMAVNEKDVVFIATDPVGLMERIEKAQGTVRLIPPKAGQKTDVAEVYYRPPENYLQPLTLLGVLRKHLCGPERQREPSQPAAPATPSVPPTKVGKLPGPKRT
jgi:transcription-repair coupling factor (superfamily II helicase)